MQLHHVLSVAHRQQGTETVGWVSRAPAGEEVVRGVEIVQTAQRVLGACDASRRIRAWLVERSELVTCTRAGRQATLKAENGIPCDTVRSWLRWPLLIRGRLGHANRILRGAQRKLT